MKRRQEEEERRRSEEERARMAPPPAIDRSADLPPFGLAAVLCSLLVQ